MNRNKKVVESMTVASALLVMTTITALGGSTEDSKGNVTGSVTLNGNGMAGVVAELHDMNIPVNNIAAASVENVNRDTVSKAASAYGAAGGTAQLAEYTAEEIARSTKEAAEEYIASENMPEDTAPVNTETSEAAAAVTETENGQEMLQDALEILATEENNKQENVTAQKAAKEQEVPATTETETQEVPAEAQEVPEATESEEALLETPQEPEEDAAWSNMVMANVEEDMNIRMEPNAESQLAGKFYRGDVAEVISIEGEWTKIVSGNAIGYVKNEYLVYGEQANQLANEVCSLYATVNTDGLRLRSEPSEDAGIVTTASDGDRLKVNKEAEGTDGWVAVYTSDSTAYVSAEYVNVELNLGTALNSEEVAEKEAQKAAEEAEAKKPAASANSDEVTLLGALIQCEAGGGSYDGMVAVGAVVMNRVRSGSYPNSISGVIYQSGQFTPAGSGGVANVLASGVRSSCLQAARDAINGTDNTNGALSFRSVSSGHAGRLIGANVFF
ncbi:MAG: SH3 domain-containing protein [Eubacterium sp.]|nr:SH3 domain-containing protein [Eubacterium sp.]